MKKIELVYVPVADQHKAKKFYSKLGFQVLRESKMDNGEIWLQMELPNQETSISFMIKKGTTDIETETTDDGKEETERPVGIMLLTDDIEKDVKMLNAVGVKTKEIMDTPWGKFTNFTDYDGNKISLHENITEM
jgi:predicted enzyme related to lactoylglutathione lyase